ncbi:Phosphoribosyltransferase family protein isoform 4 [Theobroma cacao]|uniref:Phosphoribosyltransferase family protein isoform 4 n=1 Tax=Theobroma cacao TaxID=3641 RepID=A0A061DLQ7_THECC|nr:Phosphoribosyltransferase family protein isoform 4 [Theobroma cacao]
MENNNNMGELKAQNQNKKQVRLFYCMECEELAAKVAAQSQLITLQSINWRNFDDGFPNLFINNAHDIRGQHVAFLASFSSPSVIFEQLSVIYNLPRLFVASFTLVLPFFPTGSFERMEEEGDVATAFTMARILSNIPISRGGPTSLVIYDIHALQKVLVAHGAAKVSAYVTHGVFPKRSWERFTPKNDEGSEKGFAFFWITDSCPHTVKAIGNRAPFEVLSLAGSIADALQI